MKTGGNNCASDSCTDDDEVEVLDTSRASSLDNLGLHSGEEHNVSSDREM